MQSGGGCFWRLPYLPPLQHRPSACQASTNKRSCAGGLPCHSGGGPKAHPQAEPRPRGLAIESLSHEAPRADGPDNAARRASHAQASTSGSSGIRSSTGGPSGIRSSTGGSSGSTEQAPRLVKPSRPEPRLSDDEGDGQRTKRKVPPSWMPTDLV